MEAKQAPRAPVAWDNIRLRLSSALVRLGGCITRHTDFRGFWYAVRVAAWVAPEGTDRILRRDDVEFCFPADDPYWLRLLYGGFAYEPEIDYILDRLERRNSAVFFDLGANFGYWSVRAVGKGFKKVYAVEPSSVPLSYLERNLDGLEGVTVVPKAVTTKTTETVKFYASKNNHSASSTKKIEGVSPVVVEGMHIEDLISVVHDEEYGVYKIDIEGTEGEILQRLMMAKDGYWLAIFEDHGKDIDCSSVAAVWDIDLSAKIYYLENNSITLVNDIDDVKRIKKNPKKGYNFVLSNLDLMEIVSQ